MRRVVILTAVLVLAVAGIGTQAQTIVRGQHFWDGYTRYTVSEVKADGTVIFAGSTYDPQRGVADGVDVMRLKKKSPAGRYELVQNHSGVPAFRCQWGAEVQYVRQQGMNFLAVKNAKGQTVETLVLTPDRVEDLAGQQQQMAKDVQGDLHGMSDALLMNTRMTMGLGYEELRREALRLGKVQHPDIITKTNAQLLQSELDFRDGKAEGGYDNPDGLGSDGRGPEEAEADGTVIRYDGDQYIRVHTAEQFLRSIISGCNTLVAKNTEINLTPLLDDKAWWDKQNYYFKWCSEGEPSLADVGERITSEEVFDGRQLTIQNYKQVVIRGEGNSRIVVEPRYAFCLNFMNCEQIEIRNLTIGHTVGGSCMGGVIGVQGGWRVSIRDCDLYGCGTYGFELNGTRDFSCYSSIVHDCTYGIMLVRDTESAKFETCDFRHNREFSLIDSRQSDLNFYNCRFFANDGGAKLFDVDREFFLAGCEVYHPTEKLGTIGRADQSGAKNRFDENPLNPNITSRGIGPDGGKTATAAADLWTKEAVEAQVRAMYDRLNEMARDGQLDCGQLDREFCTSHFCGALRRIYEYDRVHAKGDNRFMGDEGYHWLTGLVPPLTIERIKAELLTDNMARAQVTFRPGSGSDDEGGFMALELWLEDARWRVNNFDQPEVYGPSGYMGLMEDYARTRGIALEDK